jgi:hypothetical protein
MAQIIAFVGSPGTISGANGGKVWAANPGNTGTQVLASNTARQSIIFHNPGPTNVFVYPMLNATGGANSPTNINPSGSFLVMPGGLLTVSGECQGSWGAFSASGTGDLSIMESNT